MRTIKFIPFIGRAVGGEWGWGEENLNRDSINEKVAFAYRLTSGRDKRIRVMLLRSVRGSRLFLSPFLLEERFEFDGTPKTVLVSSLHFSFLQSLRTALEADFWGNRIVSGQPYVFGSRRVTMLNVAELDELVQSVLVEAEHQSGTRY